VSDRRHKIRVAIPSRNDVPVNVIGNSRTGCVAEINSDIKAVGIVCSADPLHTLSEQPVDFEKRLVREI